MIFSELYGAYYATVAGVLREAVSRPVTDARIRQIVAKHAFGESIVSIPEALGEERWQLLRSDGSTPLKNEPTIPMTMLQKRWLKAVSLDPRLRLFGDIDFGLEEVEPLFLPSDVIVFDKYLDGDDYSDETYIKNFRLILDAISHKYPLYIEMLNRRGSTVCRTGYPEYLEYSEKDDKFRLVCRGSRWGMTVNLGRILCCRRSDKSFDTVQGCRSLPRQGNVTFELIDERNALERVLLHFAHFEKTAKKQGDGRYEVTVCYDKADETELVIRILSFGPMIKVLSPESFVLLIKQRLMEQKSCGL